jgi:hypothetical protein
VDELDEAQPMVREEADPNSRAIVQGRRRNRWPRDRLAQAQFQIVYKCGDAQNFLDVTSAKTA